MNHQPAMRAALDAFVRVMPPFPTWEALLATSAKHQALVDALQEQIKQSERGRLRRYRARVHIAPAAFQVPTWVLLPKRRARAARLGVAGTLLHEIEQQGILTVGGQWETPFRLDLDDLAQRISVERGEAVALLRVLLARGLVRGVGESAPDIAPASERLPRSPFAAAAAALAPRASATGAVDETAFAYLPVVSGYIAWPDVGTLVLWTEETSERRGKLMLHRTVTYSGRVTRVDVNADNPKGARVWAAPDGGAEREVGIGGLRVPKADIGRFAANLAPLAAYIHEHGRLPPAVAGAAPSPPTVGARMSSAAIKAAGWSRVDPRPWTKLNARWRHPSGWRLEHCGHPTALSPWALYSPAGEMVRTGALYATPPNPRYGTAWHALAEVIPFVADVLAGRRIVPGLSPVPPPRAPQHRARSPFAAVATALGGIR